MTTRCARHLPARNPAPLPKNGREGIGGFAGPRPESSVARSPAPSFAGFGRCLALFITMILNQGGSMNTPSARLGGEAPESRGGAKDAAKDAAICAGLEPRPVEDLANLGEEVIGGEGLRQQRADEVGE